MLSPLWATAQHPILKREGQLAAVTGPIRNWKPDSKDPLLLIRTRDEKGLLQKQDLPPVLINRYRKKPVQSDTLWQRNMRRPTLPIPMEQTADEIRMPDASLTEQGRTSAYQGVFPGMAYSQINPADPSIAVGPAHIIQMVNGNNGSALFSIMDKQGNTLVGPSYLDQLPGSSHNGGGDGITWYDPYSKRFVMTEFGDSSASGTNMNTLVMAVSATADPLGSWYIYEFYADGYFPDYPKYGNWPSVWFAVTRDFKEQFEGNALWAFDKNAMISGASSVSVLKYRLVEKDNKFNSLTPVTSQGSVGGIPDGKGYFVYYSDNELTADMQDQDSVGLIAFQANFSNPTASVIQLESGFAVAPFSSMVCNTRNCAPSPNGQGYDVVSNKIMHKPGWRDYGSYQSIVLNHTVDVNGNGLSGIRWYELRKETNWKIHQQGTYSPQDPDNCTANNFKHRFLGSIMQNGAGQIAMAYNFSSNHEYASIAFTGRHADDPLNKFTVEETILEKGTGYGTQSFRWGDYNDMAPDPENDSLFWFTAMTGLGSSTWKTAIASFKVGPKPMLDAKLIAINHPTSCDLICSATLSPKISVANFGTATLQKLNIHVAIDGIEQSPILWEGFLTADAQVEVNLPAYTFPLGLSRLTIWTDRPNGQPDQQPTNDTLSITVNIPQLAQLPLAEGAESGLMPPTGWKLKTDGSSTLGWKIADNAAFEGRKSFLADHFNNNEPGKSTTLISPLIRKPNADSLLLRFRTAAALYDANKMDTLEVIISSGCGVRQETVWKKWGSVLATRTGFVQQSFVPLQSEWREEKIDLSDYTDQDFAVIFKTTNQFGNNIYLDAISVLPINYQQTDLQAKVFMIPAEAACTPLIAPKLVVTNQGKDTARKALVQLWKNNQLQEEVSWTGLLARGASDTIRFAALPNADSIQFTGIIKSVNLQRDDWSGNDTVMVIHRKHAIQNLPLLIHFEPVQELDQLTSPRLRWETADSILLNFDLAAGFDASKAADTLTIAVSFDCGLTWKTVYGAWGISLATRLTSSPFYPNKEADWKNIRIDLSGISFGKNEMLVRFTRLGNGNNNTYINNIHINTKNVLPRLKQDGYQISPNPVSNQLQVQLYPFAVGLESVQIRDAIGRLQWNSELVPGNNVQTIRVDCSGWTNGVYFVTLRFRDKVITEKIIKLLP
ncbi:MAG: hypothetical protein RLY85_1962 [Bacteroidota bacterium]